MAVAAKTVSSNPFSRKSLPLVGRVTATGGRVVRAALLFFQNAPKFGAAAAGFAALGLRKGTTG
jgi:hypothetical protein